MSRTHILAAISISIALHSVAVFADDSPVDGIVQMPMRSMAAPATGAMAISRFTVAIIGEFLIAHNKVRSNFNLPPLTWNKNLTRFARRWGTKRAADCKMIHSYGPYGENIFWGKQNHWTPTEVVKSWAKENQFYDLKSNQCAAGQICGHYTQIIWKESVRLGCARVNCVKGELLVICEYDPPGNYVNERPV